MKALVLLLALVLVPQVVGADPLPAPSLKVLSSGKGTKQPLRLTPVKGARYTVVSSTQDSKARGLEGHLGRAEMTPVIRSTMEIEITDVTKDGDVHYALAYKKVDVVPDKHTRPEVVKAYETALAAALQVKGTGVVTNRGVMKQVDFDIPSDASQELRTMFDMARSTMSQLAQPLPEEEVGVGAKWQSSFTATVGEVTADTNVTYQLVALAGGKAKLKVTTVVKGKGSGDGNLTTDTTGSGETAIDLSSIIPTSAKFSVRTEVGLDADGQRLAQVGTSTQSVQSTRTSP